MKGMIQIRLKASEKEKLSNMASSQGITLSELVRRLIEKLPNAAEKTAGK